MLIAWCSDIHLDFLTTTEAQEFVSKVKETNCDGVVITGDISTGPELLSHLSLFENMQLKTWFILGNHDYYRSSIAYIRDLATKFSQSSTYCKWLPALPGPILLGSTALLGHDCNADGRAGDWRYSSVEIRDYEVIAELRGLGKASILEVLQHHADLAAEYFRINLPLALEMSDQVVALTHPPVYEDAHWYNGVKGHPSWQPHFVCEVVGRTLMDIMRDPKYANKKLTVLSGHVHYPKEYSPTPNIVNRVAGAVYGAPQIQGLIEF